MNLKMFENNFKQFVQSNIDLTLFLINLSVKGETTLDIRNARSNFYEVSDITVT